jgi:hypothetical protein
MKKIEILFSDGCPNVELAIRRVREAMAKCDVFAELHLVRIGEEADAVERGFLGSPTIRVDGLDVDPSTSERVDFGLQCRLYSFDGHLAGVPPVEWIEVALRHS